MLSLMKKLSVIAFLLSGVLFQTCQSPSGAEENLDPKRFDGLTSATKHKFRIDSVRVYPTYADLYWWDMFDNGDTQSVMYGTDNTYSIDTIDLKPFIVETTIKTRIQPLVPNTRYYVRFYRVYENNGKLGSVAINFTTPAEAIP